MAKSKTAYSCQECGAQRPKWEGRCGDCGQWNTLVEETFATPVASGKRGWSVGASADEKGRSLKPMTLDQEISQTGISRSATNYHELDRVLGGGLVRGSYVLVGGDPGIGKSTLLMQMAGGLVQ